jgi:twinkle protein
MEHYDVRTKVDVDGRPVSIGYKYPDGRYKVRSLDEKSFRWEPLGSSGSIGGCNLFGSDRFTPGAHKYVTITEGELDALSLHQVIGGPVVSVQSSTSAGRDATSARSWLNSYERIYLAFDNDANGRAAEAAVARLFDYDKVYYVKFTSRKDANEYLQAGEAAELKNIWWAAKKFKPDNIISDLADFDKELAEAPKMGIPYPFKKLTEMTYGIRPGEVVLVTAQEKVGKTEFMHFLLHSLLKETDDAVAGLFIEETRRRTLQAIAGIELGRPVHLPDSGVTQDKVIEAVRKVVGRDDRLHLYTHSRSDDPESILDTVRFCATACACKYVLFDHPGMAVFGLGSDNERILLDALSTKLAMMVKELGFSLIVVSHVNDFGQTRGSRYLGKVCDLRIDLTRDTANSDPQIRNRIDVTIPYGRYCSNSGPVGSYLFDSWTQRYTEVANDNDPNDPVRLMAA